ncbi:MAG: hypothetical protein KF900_00745 [Bacteroidetes bacterium]|nr:hypothetical protein [Bacteroidota bacterium]
MNQEQTYLQGLKKDLQAFGVDLQYNAPKLTAGKGKKSVSFLLPTEHFDYSETTRKKIVAVLRSKLGLNTTIFARQCDIKKIDKETASNFLNAYHLMNATQSAFNYGLFFKEELIGVASFSKGRKMNRLQEHERSFELIRFCCKEGITVTGGLTKLVKNFCREKNAGDVMTYISKQFSDGTSFAKAGFKKTGESERNIKMIFTPDEKL